MLDKRSFSFDNFIVNLLYLSSSISILFWINMSLTCKQRSSRDVHRCALACSDALKLTRKSIIFSMLLFSSIALKYRLTHSCSQWRGRLYKPSWYWTAQRGDRTCRGVASMKNKWLVRQKWRRHTIDGSNICFCVLYCIWIQEHQESERGKVLIPSLE